MITQTASGVTAPTRVRSQPKRKISLTERKLIEMLTENTGRAMCDSGDYYGRNWQFNQGRDFLKEPDGTLEVRAWGDGAEIDVTLNLFPWLRERLHYDAAMTARFNKFSNRPKNKDSAYLPLMETFARDIRKGSGIYGEGNPMTVNTYNGEDLLSQIIQYVFWTEGDGLGHDPYVLLQIHGGCDVRGGYTAPKVFQVRADDETAILDNAKAEIVEVLPDHLTGDTQPMIPGIAVGSPETPYWYTDDGCHWYRDGACGSGAGQQLETYEVSTDPADRGQGKIYVDADKVAYGPIYGGKLEVYSV